MKLVRYVIVKIVWYVIAMIFGLAISEANAEHPVIAGDPGAQGKGTYQMEFTDRFDYATGNGMARTIAFTANPAFSNVLASSSTSSSDAAAESQVETSAEGKEGAFTGDGGGLRSALSKKGIDAEIVYKFDVLRNTSGGAARGTESLNNLDVKFSLDGEKLVHSPGTTGLIYFLNNNGSKPGSTLAGDAEGIDNIEVHTPGAKLYEAWIQQNFMKGELSVLAGLHDLNSEFYVNDASGLFLRPTFGVGTDMSQSGRNGPSIFPNTSVCVRVKAQPSRDYYVQIAAFDGVPGDPDNPRGTHIAFKRGDGSLIVGEADYLPGGEAPNGKVGVGAWRYTAKFDDLSGTDAFGNPLQRPSEGMYVLAERRISKEAGSDDRGLTMFARFGVANGDVNRFDYAWSAGAVYTGPFGRDQGKLGLGLEGAHNSRTYRRSADTTDVSTMAYELTYGENLTPWFLIQPDVQYIVNPDTNPALRNALVVGTRFTARF